jgi:predicted negative regulator of RcsB-dependent stress response
VIAALADASRFGDFFAGLAIGIVVGLLLTRVFWSWIAWREWRDASAEANRRAARMSDEVLQHMEQDLARQIDSSEPPLNG